MGFFGAYLYANGRWSDVDLDGAVPTPADPWMFVVVHDSDIGTIRYAPAGVGSGEAFVGFTPRSYFEDESASRPTDTVRESRGLAAWVQGVLGSDLDAPEIESFLANDDDDLDESDELHAADVFAEIKLARLLAYLGLPLPAELESN